MFRIVFEKKGYTIMHDIELFAIWFSSVFAGGILTMLMPRVASESRRREVVGETCERTSSHQMMRKSAGSMVQIVSEA